MRVLHLSDTHLGVDRYYAGAPPGWRRADDHLAAMRTALRLALDGQVDAVVHTGDLFDRSLPPPRAVGDAIEALAAVGRVVPTVVMPGNHDRRGLRRHLGDLGPGVQVVDEPSVVSLGPLRCVAIPFLRDAADWAAAAAGLCRDTVDLLLAHNAFDGARVPGFTFRPSPGHETVGAENIPATARDILCGHIHTRQCLALGHARVWMPGSTERTSFVERRETKGALLYDAAARIGRWIDLPARPMVHARQLADLDEVRPGTLVALAPELRTEQIDALARERGGWVSPWARPSAQQALFAR